MRPFWLSSVVLLSAFHLTLASTNPSTHRNRDPQSFLPASSHFAEPLVASVPTTGAEDAALSETLNAYAKRAGSDDLSLLETYVLQHPGSGWNIALETNLGLLDAHFGYFSKALSEWGAAWSQGKDLTESRTRALVDRAFGEMIILNLRTGHFDRAEALLKEVASRPVGGSAAESVDQAKMALYTLRNHPGESSLLCGPAALRGLLTSVGSSPKQLAVLDNYRSPSKGDSLYQLAQLANQAELGYGLVFRQAGQPVPVPSIVHWQFGHYAAIVGEANGKFHIQDPSFDRDLWVTRGAIDAEASGYFLAPKQIVALWRPVGNDEAGQVHGMYRIKFNEPPKATGHDLSKGKSCNATGCVAYDVHEEPVSLLLQATPVGYAPPIGPPVNVTFSYNQREAYQPANFTFFNVSSNWTLNWLTYIQDDPTTPGASVASYISGGGGEPYSGFVTATGAFTAQPSTGGVLVLVSSSPVVYQIRYPNGSTDVYSQSDGATAYPRNVFLTQKIDPAGNAVTLNYDSQTRLISLHDGAGKLTTFSYQLTAYPLLITRVTDPFGRSATLSYTSDGHLSSITDVSGLTSSYTYDASFLVNSLTTPYGVTSFTYGTDKVGGYYSLYLYIKDPLGFTEAEQFAQQAPGIPQFDPTSELPTGNIITQDRFIYDSDTYFWDKHAYAIAAGNYPMARMKTFDHWMNVADTAAPVLEAIKQPLEIRTWYNYPGQTVHTEYRSAQTGTFDFISRIGRVLDDGTTQLSQADYNSVGNVDHTVDPVGRETYYDYAGNGIDILGARQRTSSTAFTDIASYTYNTQHLPLTYKDAAGQTTTYAYNPAGQLVGVTDALGGVTQYEYDPRGYLTEIVNADDQLATRYSYDAFGRVATQTDSEGYTLSFTYDALDRLIQKSYPDGTSERYTYKNWDLAAVTDRLGNATAYAYDADRNLISTTDALGQKTTRTYYENGTLKTLTDANGNTTSWDIDVQGRITAITYPDGTKLTTNYAANTSRVVSTVDALGQSKQFTYAQDDQIAGLSYQNAVNSTPSVAFSYDPYFARIVSMTEGVGTTSYQYHSIGLPGALKLSIETGPLAADSHLYDYDALGRVTRRSVSGRGETFAYDSLGRVITHVSPLGTFNRGYLAYTNQLTSSLLSGSTIGATYHYRANADDRRLAAIDNNALGTRSYYIDNNAENQITRIDLQTQQGSSLVTTSSWDYTYDADYRLLTAANPSIGNYQYTYDPLGNATAFDLAGVETTATYNDDNQLSNLVTGGESTPFSYDNDGNLLNDGVYKYTWDAENRLLSATSIANASISTSFRYDGLGRRVAIVVANADGASETDYAWCGQVLCGSLSTAGVVSHLYYPEGEYLRSTATSLYYAQDQLGSVRDVIAVQAGKAVGTSLYDYDPYGNLTKNSGSFTPDFGYAGMLHEPNTGLDLALDGVYSPRLMRWISRQPFGELPSVNLYTYAGANPVSPCDSATSDCQSPPLAIIGLTLPATLK
jgi:RHS repeat-associated protein